MEPLCCRVQNAAAADCHSTERFTSRFRSGSAAKYVVHRLDNDANNETNHQIRIAGTGPGDRPPARITPRLPIASLAENIQLAFICAPRFLLLASAQGTTHWPPKQPGPYSSSDGRWLAAKHKPPHNFTQSAKRQLSLQPARKMCRAQFQPSAAPNGIERHAINGGISEHVQGISDQASGFAHQPMVISMTNMMPLMASSHLYRFFLCLLLCIFMCLGDGITVYG